MRQASPFLPDRYQSPRLARNLALVAHPIRLQPSTHLHLRYLAWPQHCYRPIRPFRCAHRFSRCPDRQIPALAKPQYIAAKIDGLIEERLAARAAKNWARSDEIRDMLLAQGVVLEDSKEGTTWRFE